MKLNSTQLDTMSIGFSTLCAVHCLATPLLVSVLPSLSVLNLESEAFHLSLLALVIPMNLIGLTLGCKKHKQGIFLAFGATGVALLVLAATVGHHYFGESGEKLLTILGALILAATHYRNFKLCQKHTQCGRTQDSYVKS